MQRLENNKEKRIYACKRSIYGSIERNGKRKPTLLEKLMEDDNNDVFENWNDSFQVRSTNIFTSASKFCCLSELCPHFHI
jgi:hypothetical protein